MKLNIISPYQLYLSNNVSNEIERIITKNTNVGTSLFVTEVGYFIQRLTKGLQDLTSDDTITLNDDGIPTTIIDGIGLITYMVVENNKGEMSIYIQDIKWDFIGYYLYPHLVEKKHPQINKVINLMERMEHLGGYI